MSESLNRFYEQLAYYAKQENMFSPKAYRDAAAATGIETLSEHLDGILAQAKILHRIDIEAELSDLAAKSAAVQAVTSERNYKERIREKLTGIIEAIDSAAPKELADALAAVSAEAAGHTASAEMYITAEQLMSKTYPPRQWLVEKLITPGLIILSGAPKTGKSWLMLSLAEAVSCGGNFLSGFKANRAGVLHLALEETERSIYERRRSLAFFSGNQNIIITTQWESGMDGLSAYLKKHPEIKLVIIDTLGRFMPDIEDMNDYAGTVRPLSNLKRIADDLDAAILAVHHAKKGSQNEKAKGDWMDSSLGSQGIVGSADTALVLQRDIDKDTGERKNTGRLYGTGRNIQDIFRKLTFDPDIGSWTCSEETPSANTEKKKNGKGERTDKPYGT